jgi:hypothetical protein
MPLYFNNMSCCGIKELSGLSGLTPDSVFKEFGKQAYTKSERDGRYENNRWRHAIFSQASVHAGANVYGTKFAAYIVKHKLGTVVETEELVNPNSGNYLKAWIWTVDHEAAHAFYKSLMKASKSRSKITPKKEGRDMLNG